MNYYRFAAIDIGSNAVRLLISNVFEDAGNVTFKKQSLVRVPVRLGDDAFTSHTIREEKVSDLVDALKAFRHLIKVFRPISYRAIATSALREAANAPEILNRLFIETGFKVEIITGKEEAEVVYANGLRENMDDNKSYLYMDVGGGSTELTLFSNHEAIASRSFNVGSIRLLTGQVTNDVWDEMKEWTKDIGTMAPTGLAVIGSGGNINKYNKLIGKNYGEALAYDEVLEKYEEVKMASAEERIRKYYLNPDRADVIVPAGKIFTSVMRWSGSKFAYVPKIGVSDGMIKMMYTQYCKEN